MNAAECECCGECRPLVWLSDFLGVDPEETFEFADDTPFESKNDELSCVECHEANEGGRAEDAEQDRTERRWL